MNVSRLRADIDSGKTGDKTPGLDPAAAPLGTDDEAAGTPVPDEIAEQVRARETRSDGERLARQNATPAYRDTVTEARGSTSRPSRSRVLAVGVGVAVIGCIGLLIGYGYI
jgi:hypothetical protein